MLSRGYTRKMTAGSIAVAGSLGILIPPSISFILYSLVTDASVGKPFIAGVLPGIMLAVPFAVYTVFEAMRQIRRGIANPVSTERDIPFTWSMFGGIGMIVLGGIYLGYPPQPRRRRSASLTRWLSPPSSSAR